jgi:hypothetical protein
VTWGDVPFTSFAAVRPAAAVAGQAIGLVVRLIGFPFEQDVRLQDVGWMLPYCGITETRRMSGRRRVTLLGIRFIVS